MEIHSETYKLPDYSSVFQAELLAIKKALQYAEGSCTGKIIRLYSDSRSGLTALQDADSRTELVIEIQDILNTWQGRTAVEFHWIKAHVGHPGNERADELAKAGSTDGHHCILKAPMSFAKRTITLGYRQEWENEWRTTTKGSWTKSFFPDLESRRLAKHFKPSYITTQFVTGHGKFGQYLNKRDIRTTANCRPLHCRRLQDCRHLLFECRQLQDLRSVTIAKLGMMNIGFDYGTILRTAFTDDVRAKHVVVMFEEIHAKLVEWELEYPEEQVRRTRRARRTGHTRGNRTNQDRPTQHPNHTDT